MKLNAQEYREALFHLGPEPPVFTQPSDSFREWLREKRLPVALMEFLIANSVRDNVPFPDGCGGVWAPEDIMALNDQESSILGSGLFAVGNTINGDFIVIDLLQDSQVGYVSHDELWENRPANVRQIFAVVDETIHGVLVGISSELREWIAGTRTTANYPIDYSGALERQQKQ